MKNRFLANKTEDGKCIEDEFIAREIKQGLNNLRVKRLALVTLAKAKLWQKRNKLLSESTAIIHKINTMLL